MYIPKITFAKLLHAKMFLGGSRRMWNPEIVGYLSGIRNRTSILDITQTAFRLKKFLNFVELVSSRRGRVLIILRPSFAPLAELIYPIADYFPRYVGGALSNLSHTRFLGKVKIKQKGKLVKRYPSAAVLFGDHTKRVDFMVNETVCTRTPSALLSDATTFSSAIPFQIPSTSDFGAARLMTHHILTAIRRGRRYEKLSLRHTFRRLLKRAFKTYTEKKVRVYPYTVVRAIRASSFFAADPSRRFSLLKFYFGHKLHFFRPKTFRDKAYEAYMKTLQAKTSFLSIKLAVKSVAYIRKAIKLSCLLTNVLKGSRQIPILTEEVPDDNAFGYARLRMRRTLKYLTKRKSRFRRNTKYYGHGIMQKRANITRSPYRKRIFRFKAKLKPKSRVSFKSLRRKRNRLVSLAGSKPSLAIRIIREKIQRIKSKDVLERTWSKFEKYPELRERLFKGRVHNIIEANK